MYAQKSEDSEPKLPRLMIIRQVGNLTRRTTTTGGWLEEFGNTVNSI